MEVSQLINQIKNGDEKAFETLLDNHHNMIYKIIYSLDLEKGDYLADVESLYQEGCIALYNAVYDYIPTSNMSFSSYAYMVIRGKLHTYIRDTYKNYERDLLSIDNEESGSYKLSCLKEYVSQNPVAYHREKEFEKHLNSFISKLSKQDQEIFRLRSQEYSYKQISELLNIKTKRIDNRLRVLREKLKRHLNDEDE